MLNKIFKQLLFKNLFFYFLFFILMDDKEESNVSFGSVFKLSQMSLPNYLDSNFNA